MSDSSSDSGSRRDQSDSSSDSGSRRDQSDSSSDSGSRQTTDADRWMEVALAEARAATAHDDVPVGVVVVGSDGRELARAHNRREVDGDPTAHAEIVALRAAARELGTWRLEGCSLYVTLEPCVMCAGALVLARVGRLVYGADDPKAGAVGSLYDIPRDLRLNHRLDVVGGVGAGASAELLRAFFARRR